MYLTHPHFLVCDICRKEGEAQPLFRVLDLSRLACMYNQCKEKVKHPWGGAERGFTIDFLLPPEQSALSLLSKETMRMQLKTGQRARLPGRIMHSSPTRTHEDQPTCQFP